MSGSGGSELRRELRALWVLAAPVVAAQLAMFAMGVVDIAMVGRLGQTALAAVGLGNAYAFSLLIVAMGTLTALDPLIAQAVGGGRMDTAGRTLRAGHVLALLLTGPLIAAAWFSTPVLRALGQPAALLPLTEQYVRWSLPGFWPMLAFHAQRQAVQASGTVRPVVLVALGANVVNALADWALIHGNLGCPPLGVLGAGLATSISRGVLGFGLVLATWDHDTTRAARAATGSVLPGLRRLLVFGAPIGVQFGLEVWAFNGSGFIVGMLGELPLAAHTVALNVISLTFMVPLGIAAAAAVRVGQAIGRRDPDGARRAALVSVVSGTAVMALSATTFALFPAAIGRLYTTDAAVVAVIATLLPIAALFQLVDGLQVVTIGSLRGCGETLWPAVANLIAFWVLGLPLGAALAFRGGWGARGPWIGLAVGLTAVAIPLLLRLIVVMRSPPEPLAQEEPALA